MLRQGVILACDVFLLQSLLDPTSERSVDQNYGASKRSRATDKASRSLSGYPFPPTSAEGSSTNVHEIAQDW